jgi:hypothetical protein
MYSHRQPLSRGRPWEGAPPECPELTPTLTIDAAIECGAVVYEVGRREPRPLRVSEVLYDHCCQRRLPFIRVAINRLQGTAAVQLAWQGRARPSVRARLEMEALVELENVAQAEPEVCSHGVWVPALPLDRVVAVLQQLRVLATVGPSWESQG